MRSEKVSPGTVRGSIVRATLIGAVEIFVSLRTTLIASWIAFWLRVVDGNGDFGHGHCGVGLKVLVLEN